MTSLINKVAIVTGASKGIGRGIALQLGQNGAKVYITGRTLKDKNGLGLAATASEIQKRGGTCIPVEIDHENDRQVEALFKKVEQEQNGQLDILVNCAFKGGEMIFENSNLKFWEIKNVEKSWDDINGVGLRNNYFCTVYASRLMVPRKQGLIVNITSLGGMQYAFNAAYGIGKAGVDRMSADCGVELKKHKVTCLSLLLGGVKTEMSQELVRTKGDKAVLKLDPNNPFLNEIKLIDVINDAESVEFAGKVISKLATDPNLFNYTSKVIIAAEYAQKHGIKDIDGRTIPSHRQINSALKLVLPNILQPVTKLIPNFIKVPQFIMDVVTTKF